MKFSYYSYLERVCAEIAELEKLVANQTETDDPNGDNLTTLNQQYEIKNELLSELIFVADRVNFLGKKEGTVVYQCDRFLVVDFDDGSHSIFDDTNVHFLFKKNEVLLNLTESGAMALMDVLFNRYSELQNISDEDLLRERKLIEEIFDDLLAAVGGECDGSITEETP